MRFRNLAAFGGALLAGALCGSALGPRPALAVAREIIELQRDVTTLLQGQKDLSTQLTQDHTVMRTLLEQSNDTVGKLNGTMSGLQKSVQDVQANSGPRSLRPWLRFWRRRPTAAGGWSSSGSEACRQPASGRNWCPYRRERR